MNKKSSPASEEFTRIEKAFEEFQVFRNQFLRRSLDYFPGVIFAASLLVAFFHWQTYQALQVPYLTMIIAMIGSFLLARRLFDYFPSAIQAVWQRQVLQPKAADEIPEQKQPTVKSAASVLSFVQRSEDRFNSRWGWAVGILGMAVVVWILWLIDSARVFGAADTLQVESLRVGLRIAFDILDGLIGLIGGLILWRVMVVAVQIRALSRIFEFNVQLDHPDHCGGLRPLGDVCLWIAYVLSPLMFLIGGWILFFLLAGSINLTPDRNQYLISSLQLLLIPTVLFSLLGFFLPLLAVHAGMQRAKVRWEIELNSIGVKIQETSKALHAGTEKLSVERGEELEKTIEFLKRVYDRNSKMPTWPIDFDHVWRLAATNILPLVTLGTSTSITELVKKIFTNA